MCGRFWLDCDIEDVFLKYKIRNQRITKWTKGDFYPSSNIPIVFEDEERNMEFAKWGFYFKDKKGIVINARAETVKSKQMFKNSFYNTRCIIPANMFYEWKDKGNKKKDKYKIGLKDSSLISLGGIYKISFDENHIRQLTVVIITTEAEGNMKTIHSRMPLIIKDDDIEKWLNRNTSIKDVEKVLKSNFNNKFIVKRCGIDNEKYEQLKLF